MVKLFSDVPKKNIGKLVGTHPWLRFKEHYLPYPTDKKKGETQVFGLDLHGYPHGRLSIAIPTLLTIRVLILTLSYPLTIATAICDDDNLAMTRL